MLVRWDPENGEEKQQWSFDPGDVLRKDAKLIEKHFGGSWDEWVAALHIGGIDARTVLLWYMMKLVHPKLPFDDVPDFKVRQLKVDMGTLELKQLADRVKKMRISEDTREAFEARLELDLREAMEREGIEADVSIVDGQLSIESDDPALANLPKAP